MSCGEGLAGRVSELAPEGVTAAADLFGTETAQAALDLGVEPERIDGKVVVTMV